MKYVKKIPRSNIGQDLRTVFKISGGPVGPFFTSAADPDKWEQNNVINQTIFLKLV